MPRDAGITQNTLLARLPDGGLIDGCKNDNRPDFAGIEGSPLDTWQGELVDYVFRYVLHV